MSEANRAQVTSYLNDAWSFLRQDLAESRSLTTAEIDSLANSLPLLQSAENLLFANLVDTLLYEPEMKAYLRTLLNIGEDDKIPSATVAEMNSVTTKQVKKPITPSLSSMPAVILFPVTALWTYRTSIW